MFAVHAYLILSGDTVILIKKFCPLLCWSWNALECIFKEELCSSNFSAFHVNTWVDRLIKFDNNFNPWNVCKYLSFKSPSFHNNSKKRSCLSEFLKTFFQLCRHVQASMSATLKIPIWCPMCILLYTQGSFQKINCWKLEELAAVMWGTRDSNLMFIWGQVLWGLWQSSLFIFSRVWLHENVDHFLNPSGIKEIYI